VGSFKKRKVCVEAMIRGPGEKKRDQPATE